MVVDAVVEQGHSQGPAQHALAYLGHDELGVDFLKHQRDGNHQVGVNLVHGLDNDFGRGNASQQGDVGTHGKLAQHVEGTPVGVSQGQERHHLAPPEAQLRVDAIHDVARQVVACDHHALAEARGARGVVDDHELLVVDFGVLDVSRGEPVGIGSLEEVVDLGQGLAHGFSLLLGKQAHVVERDGSPHLVQHVEVDAVEHRLARHEQHRVAVIDDVLGIVGVEFLQDGHNHGAIGNGGHEGGHPRRGVLAYQGNVVASLDAYFVVKQVNLGNELGKLTIGEGRLGVVVGHCREVPVFFEAARKNLDRIFLHHNFEGCYVCVSDAMLHRLAALQRVDVQR